MAKKKAAERSRRERVEQMRREQRAAERRRTIAMITAFSLVGLVLLGVAAYQPVMNWINDPGRRPMSEFGVSAARARCTTPTSDPVEGQSDHRPDGEKILYKTAPPAVGPHWEVPAAFERKFYEAKDRPPLERLVHNLEHGYTIVWYDETVAEDSAKLDTLRTIAQRFDGREYEPDKKFIVAPWTKDDGKAFPKGKHIAMTRWTTEAGRRSYCSDVSGPAIEAFMKKYPWQNSPEPNAM